MKKINPNHGIGRSAEARIDVLLDQKLFALDPDKYAAFLHVLDAPPVPNDKLREFMSSKATREM